MSPSPLPVSNSTTSFWRSEPHSLDNHRSTAELPVSVDIAIIGAGYAGASTVYHILKTCREQNLPTPSILILEARGACSGATGRNGGHIKPDPFNVTGNLALSHGIEVASEFAVFEAQNLSAIKQLVEEESIDCDFILTRCTDTFMTDSIYRKMKATVEMLTENGVPVMSDVFFAEGKKAEQLSGVKGAKACFTYSAGHLFPYKLVLHMLSGALEAGANLQTWTPVTEVTSRPDADGKVILKTSRGPVKASKVVYATNAYTSALLPEFENKIVPVRGICSHIVPAKTPSPVLSNSYIIRRSPRAYEYLIPRLDGSVVVGGGREKYMSDLDNWYNIVNDDKLIDAAKDYFDGYMQRTFYSWEDSGAKTSKVWTGIMGYSSDGLPWVGAVPGRTNQFVLAGFTGHGMPQAFLTAKGVACMVVDAISYEESGVPRTYELTKSRLENPKNAILDDWKANHQATAKL